MVISFRQCEMRQWKMSQCSDAWRAMFIRLFALNNWLDYYLYIGHMTFIFLQFC